MSALNIDERQVFINFDYDANFRWHHRVLLHGLGDSRWIWATPDLEVQMGDLADHEVVLLARGARVPRRCHGAYMFDPISAADLADLHAQAKDLSTIMGSTLPSGSLPTINVEKASWRVSDARHPAFGAEVPVETVATEATFISKGDVALVLLDGSWTTCALSKELETGESFGARLREGAGRDPRLLATRRQFDGRRFYPFPDLVGAVTESKVDHWPISGPRSVAEFLAGVRQAGFESLVAYHAFWLRSSGVSDKAGVAREHKLLCEVVRLAGEFDQVNIAGLSSMELLARRIYQIEMAVRKNPKTPDFNGLEMLVDTATDSSGSVVVSSVQQWLASQQRDEAFILKQRRLWSEESASANKPEKGDKNKDKDGK